MALSKRHSPRRGDMSGFNAAPTELERFVWPGSINMSPRWGYCVPAVLWCWQRGEGKFCHAGTDSSRAFSLQHHEKCAALANRAFHPNPAAVCQCDFSSNGKSEAGAAFALAGHTE